ncbi:MAG: hypothetical protein ABIM74_09660 [candidate division WOR-3 bacterium]
MKGLAIRRTRPEDAASIALNFAVRNKIAEGFWKKAGFEPLMVVAEKRLGS